MPNRSSFIGFEMLHKRVRSMNEKCEIICILCATMMSFRRRCMNVDVCVCACSSFCMLCVRTAQFMAGNLFLIHILHTHPDVRRCRI